MNSRQILERNPHLITLAQSLARRCSISSSADSAKKSLILPTTRKTDCPLGPSTVIVCEKMFPLRVALLFLVCYATCSWAQTDASLTPITALPCNGYYSQNVSLYSSDIYTVVYDLSQCSDLETNETMVRTRMDIRH